MIAREADENYCSSLAFFCNLLKYITHQQQIQPRRKPPATICFGVSR